MDPAPAWTATGIRSPDLMSGYERDRKFEIQRRPIISSNKFLSGMTRYFLRRRLGGPQGRSERVRVIRPLPGSGSRIVYPVASRCRGLTERRGRYYPHFARGGSPEQTRWIL